MSSKVFNALDNYMWWLTYRWARHTHPMKSAKWITFRYFGRFNRFRNDRWVFGDPAHPLGEANDMTVYMVKFAWTNIVRHVPVAGGASPDDPDLTDYWAKRRRKIKPALDNYNLRLLTQQDGRCPLCGDPLLTADQPQSPRDWERWWLSVVKRAIAVDYLTHQGRADLPNRNRTRLVHTSCHRSLRARARRSQHNPNSPSGACLSRVR